MDPDQVAFNKTLEQQGEPLVRHLITQGRYSGNHSKWAVIWISEIDQRRSAEQEARNEASNAEHLRIARSEKSAAWIAAISAIIAIIISIMALYLSWLGLDRS